jgi:predicted ArsR family transcriptional regulator
MAALEDEGYEPRLHGAEVLLANCRFHALVEEQRDLVCGMNRDLSG